MVNIVALENEERQKYFAGDEYIFFDSRSARSPSKNIHISQIDWLKSVINSILENMGRRLTATLFCSVPKLTRWNILVRLSWYSVETKWKESDCRTQIRKNRRNIGKTRDKSNDNLTDEAGFNTVALWKYETTDIFWLRRK